MAFMIKCYLSIAPVFLQIILQEEVMGWHPSGVSRARILVIELNFGECLIKGNEI